MLGSNQRPPPCKGEKGCYWGLHEFANPAYLSCFLFSGFPTVAASCGLGDVEVLPPTLSSIGVKASDAQRTKQRTSNPLGSDFGNRPETRMVHKQGEHLS